MLVGCMQDVGCCFGQDTRRLELDGVPHSSIYSTDIISDYWWAIIAQVA